MLNAARSYAQKRASEPSVSNWFLRSTKVGVVLQQVSSKIFPRFIEQTNPHNTCYHAVLATQWFKRAGSAACNSPARHTVAAIPLQKSWSKMTPVRRYTTQSEVPTPPPKNKPEKYSAVLARRLRAYRDGLKRLVGLTRPYTIDKILPLFNVMFLGIGISVLVGTTSIISLGVWVVNRNDKWQEMFVQYLKEKLTEQTGVNITFDQVKGSWKEGTLKLHNVKVVRDPSTFPEGQDRNVSIMDLSVELIAVKVSLLWFLQGKGWLKDVSVSGVRGTIDRRYLDWSGPPLPPRTWKRGDFVFENLLLSNVELGMFNPTPNRELKIKLHVLDCGRVRRQWLLHDLLSAKSVYGIFDGSLFSLTRSLTDSDKIKNILKIDGIKMDIITSSATGPLSWITEGTLDIESELDFHPELPEVDYRSFSTFQSDAYSSSTYYPIDSLFVRTVTSEDVDAVAMKIQMRLNNLRAAVPLTPPELGFLNAALVRPVVAYMNTNYTQIPFDFTVVLDKQNFDGAWSPYEAKLFDAISIAVGREFVELVREQSRPSNIPRHFYHVFRSIQRGIYFLVTQMQGYYELWYFNNEFEDNEGNIYIDLPEQGI